MLRRKNTLKSFSDEELKMCLVQRKLQSLDLHDQLNTDHNKELFFLNKEIDDSFLAVLGRDRFNKIKHAVEKEFHLSPSDKRLVIESFRKIITLDIAYSYMANAGFVRNNENDFKLEFPVTYLKDNKINYLKKEKKEILLDGNILVSTPYDINKWLFHLKRKTDLDPAEFEPGVPYYYPSLNLIIQGNGNIHRTAEAFLNGKNQRITVYEFVDDEELFKNISTDGEFWFNVWFEQEKIVDYRLALIFELKKMLV